MDASPSRVDSSTGSAVTGLPDEIVGEILLQCSTPTFLQLIRTSKEPFQRVASDNRKVLLHHLRQIPGDKDKFQNEDLNNEQLFLLLRQRAANNLYGSNFTANMVEYVNRNVDLDMKASSISGLDADYVRMALVFKNANDIRQYTSHCQIKEKIEQPPGGRILKLVQWNRIISVLYEFPDEQNVSDSESLANCSSGSDESETEVLNDKPFPPTANARLTKFYTQQKQAASGFPQIIRIKGKNLKYRVTHFDIYTIEDSQTYEVEQYRNYVPRDFAVQSLTQCAILWDLNMWDGSPTQFATVINYRATELDFFHPTKYEAMTVWPKVKVKDMTRRDTDSDSDDEPEHLPESIAFFKDGRRIKMYEAGGVVPYQIFSTSSAQHDPYASTNVISYGDFSVQIDTPFYGTHNTFLDELSQLNFCQVTHLCLGTTTLELGKDGSDEFRILCILRSQTRLVGGCDHRITLNKMPHVSADNTSIVARLWGWEGLHTNVSGKDIVSISPGGTRIAIAMWNKVYVYPLNPRILCEESVLDSSDDEAAKSKKKKKKSRRPWEFSTSAYYSRRCNTNLQGWKVVELRPVVLDLNGAVAHKLSWSPAKGKITDAVHPSADAAPLQSAEDSHSDADVVQDDAASGSDESAESNTVTPDQTAELSPQDATAPAAESAPSGTQVDPPLESELNSGAVEMVPTEPASGDGILLSAEPGAISVPPDAGTEIVTGDIKSSEKDENVISASPVISAENLQQAAASTESAPPSSLPLPNAASTSIPISPPSILPLSNSLPSTYPSSTPAPPSLQTSKIIPRKEKFPEITSQAPSKYHSPYTQYTQKPIPEVPSPPSPTLSKESIKPKQTVSEVLANDASVIAISPNAQAEPNQQPEPPSTPAEVPTTSDLTQREAEASSVLVAPNQGAAEEGEEADKTAASLSKTTCDVAPSLAAETQEAETQPLTSGPIETESPSEEKTAEPHRRKRITEDELLILTDRGIQVWNLGAAAKGIRKRKVLPLEESLAGKVPLRKGKGKEDEGNDADVDE